MMRLTAYVSGRVRWVGYRAKIISMAHSFGLVGLVQNRPDGRVLVIAEGEKETVEKFESAIKIENALINVENVDASYTHASGEFSVFRKITGPDEIGERLDDGIEILKYMMLGINKLIAITEPGFDGLNSKMDSFNVKMDGLNCRMDKMLDKQDDTIDEIKGLRRDLTGHMDQRFEYIESELAEIKSALRVKGII
ncbi:MAG: acylphosphatase [Methanothrix sp.]|nr:acylphosphatase [Methanothrix sp.]